MDITIHANETETVLEALNEYRTQLREDIATVKKSTETWAVDPIVRRMEMRSETLNRVIARIEAL
ncbi:hypothetical protein SAMN05720470_10123 [Fibrobacter sp. UWOV1]|uniref:hypothetical protein n=1 Tax=Fibrobacter sp. UWOV1 TaxID=1896215 RepID=UPI0009235992|nr:hypothetical protein [Fibrobacter sp. UWOV1]SHK27964.1 hypothetical protein SAMN05720470_10123 [Fibrobacter sp. UWOV1]